MSTITYGGVTWTDGELSGDATQIQRLETLRDADDGYPVFYKQGGQPYHPGWDDPVQFYATARQALGWGAPFMSDGVDWPQDPFPPGTPPDVVVY